MKEFLVNTKAANYNDLVETLLSCFRLHHEHKGSFPHIKEFPANEQGEPVHQTIKIMKERYKGRWNTHMMAEFCKTIKRVCVDMEHSRSSHNLKFVP